MEKCRLWMREVFPVWVIPLFQIDATAMLPSDGLNGVCTGKRCDIPLNRYPGHMECRGQVTQRCMPVPAQYFEDGILPFRRVHRRSYPHAALHWGV